MIATTAEPRAYPLRRWDLSAMLPEPSEPVLAERFQSLERAVADFESCRERLAPEMDAAEFLAVVKRYEALSDALSLLTNYASLWFAEDTGRPEALTLMNRVQQEATAAGNRVLFFTLWWKGLDDAQAAALTPRGEENADYRHFLADLRRFRVHTLDERAEQIVNLKDDNGIQAMVTLYSMLTNRLEFKLTIDGEEKRLTRDALLSHAFSPRADLRAAAYRALYGVFANEAPILGQIYTNRVLDWHNENVTLRGYPSPVSVRNLDNDVSDRAVEVLLAATRENAPLFQRYFRLKAGWLGLDRLRRYDLYAPLAASEREVPYAEAVRSVLDTLGEFHPVFARRAEQLFADNHVDSEIRKGKRSGAFCSTVAPHLTPWVLVNYAGRVRDVATLAHELGHAIHSMMADRHSSLTQHASLPLAETASVFSEMLMTDRLLRDESDPLARRELLAAAIDDVYATVLRQSYFVLFEIDAHRAVLDGASQQDLSDLYMAKLQEQFGESVDISPEFRDEWLCIPHIYHTPFYCYAYSFGQLLVLALYRRYQEMGEAFKPGYLKLLSYGGAARPVDILREMGIDIEDRAFWQSGFDLVRERIDELERLSI